MKDKLTVVIGSCDSYNNLWKNFDILFKRYWEIDTTNIFISETKSIPYNDYINVLPGIGLAWGERMLAGLDLVTTPYVCFLLEDYYLTETIDSAFIEEHINILNEYNADKVMFDKIYPADVYNLTYIKDNIYQFNNTSMYLNSVQPAIWKTDYLKQVLLPQYSPWQFELDGNSYTQKFNPKILLKARDKSIYFNYARVGGRVSEGWESIFYKEKLTNEQ
jgi:hypothetical protein